MICSSFSGCLLAVAADGLCILSRIRRSRFSDLFVLSSDLASSHETEIGLCVQIMSAAGSGDSDSKTANEERLKAVMSLGLGKRSWDEH